MIPTNTKKEFLIITACDSKYGDFLINHWLKSLMDNVKLDSIDIVVLDYGLTQKQKEKLLLKKVKVIKYKRDGHVVNIRYRDMLKFLKKTKYKQVLACDSGDIIFQGDISHLFKENQKEFRAVCEDHSQVQMFAMFMNSFSPSLKKKILDELRGEKMINGGFVIAPVNKFKELCKKMNSQIKDKNNFGPDQILLNYELYSQGFFRLDNRYNYIPPTMADGLKIKDGIFYKKDGTLISVLHNAGRTSFFRVIKKFGYGPNNNRFNIFTYSLLRGTYKMMLFYESIFR